jgi:hypothetical protein
MSDRANPVYLIIERELANGMMERATANAGADTHLYGDRPHAPSLGDIAERIEDALDKEGHLA